jgi:ABC-2 type transport system permease protein
MGGFGGIRRTVIFAVIAPVLFFLAFGLNSSYANKSDGHGNVSAFIMVSMALYGAVLATTSGGAMVSIERAAGWSRQLRLTPLSPAAYITIKILTALVLGLCSVVAVFVVGMLTGKPSMPGYLWIVTALCVWIGSLIFAAFGLLMGICCRPRTSCSSWASAWRCWPSSAGCSPR